MGAYLSEPNREKISIDGDNDSLRYGASAMQGWRLNQEDSHNCCPEFHTDTNTSLFAVYDGHGGAEVAQYTAMYYPDFLKNSNLYKDEKLSKALEQSFLDFDDLLTKEHAIKELKEIAGTEADDEEDVKGEAGREEVATLCEEATMPVQEVLERYRQNLQSLPAHLRKDEKYQSPVIKAKADSHSKQDGESNEAAASTNANNDTVRAKLDAQLLNGHSENENNVNLERERENNKSSAQDTAVDSTTKDTKTAAKKDAYICNEADSTVSSNLTNGSSSTNCSTNLSEDKPSSSTEVSIGDSSVQDSANPSTGRSDSKDSEPCKETRAGDSGSNEVTPGGSREETEAGDSGNKEAVAGGSAKEAVAGGSAKEAVAGGSAKEAVAGGSAKEAVAGGSAKEAVAGGSAKEAVAGSSGCSSSSKIDDCAAGSSSGSKTVDDDEDDEDFDSEEDSEEWTTDDEEDMEGMPGSDSEDDDDDEEEEGEVMCGGEEPGMDSGCTAVVAILRGKDLYVANAGDSRCIVCRDGKAVDMSVDHKPEDDLERNRIEEAGGRVTPDGRVNGGLNLSRAIGDHCYKQNTIKSNREQMITALPDVRCITLDDKDQYMVLACDGIWNAMTSQDVVDFVSQRMAQGVEKMSTICEEMFEFCLAPDTTGDGTGCDNMTAIIVKFKDLTSKSSNKRPVSSSDNETINNNENNKDEKPPECKKAREEDKTAEMNTEEAKTGDNKDDKKGDINNSDKPESSSSS